MGSIKRHPREDQCASCGCDLPLDSTGGYTCEVYTCTACQSIICEDCRWCPAAFQDGLQMYFFKYFVDLGYDMHDLPPKNFHDSYCKACLVKVEESYINSIPAADLLLHVNDEWYWDEGRQLFCKRLSEGR